MGKEAGGCEVPVEMQQRTEAYGLTTLVASRIKKVQIVKQNGICFSYYSIQTIVAYVLGKINI